MIYFVADDNSIRKLVLYSLTSAGMEAEGFARPGEFWSALDRQIPQVVLLDIMLPEEDGISILKRLRASRKTKRLQVILLTAKGSEYDKVVGLDAGADDYVSKPFGMMELMARVRSALRRAEDAAPSVPILSLGELSVDRGRHLVRVAGEDVALTLKEFQLLCLLLERPGTVFTRDQLLSTVWGYDFEGTTRTVDTHVKTLRQKLGDEGRHIVTLIRSGYKFEVAI